MIDIQYIRDNAELVQRKTNEKGYKVDIRELLKVDGERRALLQEIEVVRARRNEIAESMKGGKPEQTLIDEGKKLKESLAVQEAKLDGIEKSYQTLLQAVPNPHVDEVPVGDESASVEVSQFGGQETGAEDHLDFITKRGWVDFERGAKVAGTKFYFLKNELAELELALTRYGLDFLMSRGFTYMTVPHMVNSRVATGAGFASKGSDEGNEYFIEDEDLTLIGTAEAPLTGYHADEILDEKSVPLLYAGYSPCYRREAGTYGKHTRGLFRVHQFNKLEMYAFTLPEQSVEMHEKLRGYEEELWQSLQIPYHIINIASGDLGAPAAKKYDLEYWSKVDGVYRELTSCSNCTDFQARNLNIRIRKNDGTVVFAHTLNGTAISMARSLIAIIEHYQTDDGRIRVPEVLIKYMGGKELL